MMLGLRPFSRIGPGPQEPARGRSPSCSGSFGLVVLGLLGLALVPTSARASETSRVLAAGEIRFGHLLTRVDRQLLAVDRLGRIDAIPFRRESYQRLIDVDLDLEAQNSLAVDTLLDFELASRSGFYDPADFQGGRYRNVDLLARLTWGHELAPETLVSLEATGLLFQDRLFPELDAGSGRLALRIDQELGIDTDLVLAFELAGSRPGSPPDSGYREGSFELVLDHFRPFALGYEVLPAHPGEPVVPPTAFTYTRELKLHESVRHLPLQDASTIRPFFQEVPEPDPQARFFAEHIAHRNTLTRLRFRFTHRDPVNRGIFPDFNRFEAEAAARISLTPRLDLRLQDVYAYQNLESEDAARFLLTHHDNVVRAGLVFTRSTLQASGHASFRVLRFPQTPLLDQDQLEARLSSVQTFGKRFWLLSDIAALLENNRAESAVNPDRRSLSGRLGFLVDFDHGHHLDLVHEEVDVDVPRFPDDFDASYRESRSSVTYHHRWRPAWSFAAGLLAVDRTHPALPASDRDELTGFLSSTLRL